MAAIGKSLLALLKIQLSLSTARPLKGIVVFLDSCIYRNKLERGIVIFHVHIRLFEFCLFLLNFKLLMIENRILCIPR